jgi:hypothetical protein
MRGFALPSFSSSMIHTQIQRPGCSTPSYSTPSPNANRPPYLLEYTPIIQAPLNTASPHAIPILSQTTFNLLPLTSFHPTGTSTIGIIAPSLNINISTSKIQPSMCMYGIM